VATHCHGKEKVSNLKEKNEDLTEFENRPGACKVNL
jgi:hypothetical protein